MIKKPHWLWPYVVNNNCEAKIRLWEQESSPGALNCLKTKKVSFGHFRIPWAALLLSKPNYSFTFLNYHTWWYSLWVFLSLYVTKLENSIFGFWQNMAKNVISVHFNTPWTTPLTQRWVSECSSVHLLPVPVVWWGCVCWVGPCFFPWALFPVVFNVRWRSGSFSKLSVSLSFFPPLFFVGFCPALGLGVVRLRPPISWGVPVVCSLVEGGVVFSVGGGVGLVPGFSLGDSALPSWGYPSEWCRVAGWPEPWAGHSLWLGSTLVP